VGVSAAAVARGATLLAAWPAWGWWWGLCRRGGRRRGVVCGCRGALLLGVVGQGVVGIVDLGRASKEAVAEVADFGLQERDLGFEPLLALAGAVVQGFVGAGLLSGVGQGALAVGQAAGGLGGARQGGGGGHPREYARSAGRRAGQ
jgi:hypothetical protein